MSKILNIVGARPQFIKAFITIKSINKDGFFKNYLLHTGQHFDYQMSEIFFKELNFSKNLIKINLTKKYSRIIRISEMISKVYKLTKKIKPDLIVVYGDTDSTLVGSIVARRLNIKLMHVEAGLRSNIVNMPEEQNRVFADYLSDYLICPNKEAYNNIKFYKDKKIFNFGDVMFDSFLYYKRLINNSFSKYFKLKYNLQHKYVFLTIHRDANSSVNKLFKFFTDISKLKYRFFFPIHPKLKIYLKKKSINIPNNIIISKPLSYLESLAAIKNSQFVVTDSGGVQKEAYFYNKKCFVLRAETEWKDLIKAKAVKLIDFNILKINQNSVFLKSKIIKKNYFGNGKSTLKILKLIKLILKNNNEKK